VINAGIYRITHLATGRIYIGQSGNLSRRLHSYKTSGGSGNGKSVIKRAIQKYGWGSFSWEVLLYAKDQEYLNLIETRVIAAYGSQVPVGFNIEAGGLNAPMSDESRAKLSAAKTGLRLSEATKDKLRVTSAQMWANKTPEQRAHTSAMLSAALKGRTHKEDRKEKLSEVRKAMFASGELAPTPGFKGRKHSAETKEKMRLARTGRRHTMEDKEKMRLQALERWQSEEYRNNVLVAKGYKK
jgi:group I intron endonuclease